MASEEEKIAKFLNSNIFHNRSGSGGVASEEVSVTGIHTLLPIPQGTPFYTSIETQNTGGPVVKDFLAVFGTYDSSTGEFTVYWGHVATNVTINSGSDVNDVPCEAMSVGTWDVLGAIGTYDEAAGTFTIESAVVVEDLLTITEVTEVYLAEAVTCKWINGWRDHGPMVTEFTTDETMHVYLEWGPESHDFYGDTIRVKWYHNGQVVADWEYTITEHWYGVYWPLNWPNPPAGNGYVEAYWNNQYLGKTNNYTVIGLECEDYTNYADCIAAGCYWWNGSCHDSQPTECSQLNNQSDCEAYGCFWYDGTCHSEPLGVIGEIHPSSEFYTGPFPPGEHSIITYLVVENTGGHSGIVYVAIYEYPGEAGENRIDLWGVVLDAGETIAYNINKLIPDLPGETWPLGIKVWGTSEAEPGWGTAEKTHQWEIQIAQPEICDWIDAQGGPNALTIDDVFVIIDSYLYNTPPSGYTFIPTLQNVFGVIDYYLGFNGDVATGCDFYP